VKSRLLFAICLPCLASLAPLVAAKAAPPADLPDTEFGQLAAALAKPGARSAAQYERLLPQVASPEALLAPDDRDPADVVLRRTRALVDHLKTLPGAPDLAREEAALRRLADAAARTAVADAAARQDLFARAAGLRRQIAFRNPLLQGLDRILFVKRDRAKANHMCDQYFGFMAQRGGGLFVLSDPFGADPKLTDLLADAAVRGGRFDGQKLVPGAFLSPDLSFDARTILFAYTEGEATPFKWTPQSTYHIFRVNADGSDLVPLTDGAVNDFDPCWMPDGRIVFTSERRGGYGRCHPRPVPLYTLHTMNADGTGIRCISPHEANEWHPSIDHGGMIVYSRWDYIDRGFSQAHHPWRITPDGRDARDVSGNYALRQTDRPNMELQLRAIPGSSKLVAVAAAHHGQAYGSLILIDPTVSDDGQLSQLKRITPDARFPECEPGAGPNDDNYYATPWPLSEVFFLCVYSPAAARGKYGIYLVDVFGNRELLYADPSISCLDPIPLRPRPAPPVVPQAADPPAETGRMVVVNVYNSRLPMPEGVKITALRVVQVLPKSTPLHHQPQIGYGCETGARAVLGTVPVEADGSAYFTLPAGKEVYFQALDEQGLAVQSMKSGTWVPPGGLFSCNGCHDRREQAPSAAPPLALKRPPSHIRPDVDGSNPFSFPRLVQPVLEKNCVACHAREADKKPPDLTRGDFLNDKFRWYASYRSLARYAFHNGAARQDGYDGWAPPRSIPGQVGARASKLYPMLRQGHHDLKLAPEDLHCLALWLDCNSDFFGSQDDVDAQARGEVVAPTLE
jgi:hypothetical protein